MDAKVYVQVNADFNADGVMLPRVLTWENGEMYLIDRVLISGRPPHEKLAVRATATPLKCAVK